MIIRGQSENEFIVAKQRKMMKSYQKLFLIGFRVGLETFRRVVINFGLLNATEHPFWSFGMLRRIIKFHIICPILKNENFQKKEDIFKNIKIFKKKEKIFQKMKFQKK